MNDKCIFASYLPSPLSKISFHRHNSPIKKMKDPQSKKGNDLLKNKTLPIALFDILLTLCDTDKKYNLKGGLLNMINNRNYNVDLATKSEKNYRLNLQRKCILMENL